MCRHFARQVVSHLVVFFSQYPSRGSSMCCCRYLFMFAFILLALHHSCAFFSSRDAVCIKGCLGVIWGKAIIFMDSPFHSFFDELIDVESGGELVAPPSTPAEDTPRAAEVAADDSGAMAPYPSSLIGVNDGEAAITPWPMAPSSSSLIGVNNGETAITPISSDPTANSPTLPVTASKVRKRTRKGAARIPRCKRVWRSCHVCGHRNHNRRLFCTMCISPRRSN